MNLRRWCRTYFLQRGRTAAAVEVSAASDDLLAEYANVPSEKVPRGVTSSLLRLEGLYMKLLLSLRLVVKLAFARHSDVLEAGTEVQVRICAKYLVLFNISTQIVTYFLKLF